MSFSQAGEFILIYAIVYIIFKILVPNKHYGYSGTPEYTSQEDIKEKYQNKIQTFNNETGKHEHADDYDPDKFDYWGYKK